MKSQESDDDERSATLAKIGLADYSGKSEEEMSGEFAEAVKSRNLKKLRNLQHERDIRILLKIPDLDEIKCFLEKMVLRYEKRPADFQNAINFYAKSMFSHQKDRQEMNGLYYDFLNQVSGASVFYERYYEDSGLWNKIRKFLVR